MYFNSTRSLMLLKVSLFNYSAILYQWYCSFMFNEKVKCVVLIWTEYQWVNDSMCSFYSGDLLGRCFRSRANPSSLTAFPILLTPGRSSRRSEKGPTAKCTKCWIRSMAARRPSKYWIQFTWVTHCVFKQKAPSADTCTALYIWNNDITSKLHKLAHPRTKRNNDDDILQLRQFVNLGWNMVIFHDYLIK